MDDMPLITVIVPVYNILEYLPRCVRSITAQSYRNLEILLVDDGSTDGTGDLCERLAEEDGRIRVFHKENGGTSAARNLGLAHASGEYVGFVDSDDYIEPDMYEKLLWGIRKFHVPAAQIARDERDENDKPLSDICEPPAEPQVVACADFMRELLLHRGDCSLCTKLIRRELFPREAFPTGKLNEDFHLIVRMLPDIGRLVSLPAEIVKRDYPELTEVSFRFGIFQRLEYMLHIPIAQMNRDNAMYRGIVSYLRKNWFRSMGNPVLTGKNKIYHTLFALAPRGIRKLHAMVRLRGA